MLDSAIRLNEPMTVEAFLAFCETVPRSERWELIDGVPMMMTGGTAAHSLMITNLVSALDPAARKRGCRAMTSFLAGVSDENASEPDVVVRCGTVDPRRRYADDPTVVFEVLSPSTLHCDRGTKFERYCEIPSLRQIVLVYQDSVRVESWSRESNDWDEEATVLLSLDESLAIPAIETALPLTAIYEDVA